MVKKEGKIPANCRVDVDYTEVKPKIKFGYTSKNPKKDAYNQNKYNTFSAFFILGVFFLVYSFFMFPSLEDYPKSCNVTFDDFHSNTTSQTNYSSNGVFLNYTSNSSYDSISGANFTCDNGNFSVYYSSRDSYLEPSGFYYTSEDNTKRLLIFGFVLLVSLVLATWFSNRFTKWLIKQKWYQKWLPKHMAGGKNKSKCYYKFKPSDVLENVIIVPKFKNIELTYETEGDFSNQLQRIKIREYRHNKYKKQKVGKLVVDNYSWYAIFYFKEKPKDGHMEVFYQ